MENFFFHECLSLPLASPLAPTLFTEIWDLLLKNTWPQLLRASFPACAYFKEALLAMDHTLNNSPCATQLVWHRLSRSVLCGCVCVLCIAMFSIRLEMGGEVQQPKLHFAAGDMVSSISSSGR